jgi:DNA-binding MarR family transcriptional regulator
MKALVQQDDKLSKTRVERPVEGQGWTFLTNHSHVLISLSQEPDLRLRDVAERVGITERAVQRIIADLESAGILTRNRDGRRNTYEIHAGEPLRHPLEAHCKISDLLRIVEPDGA